VKILFVDASRAGWGTEQHLVALAGALSESGHAVTAVVKRGSTVEALLGERGLRIYATAFRGGADPRGILAIIRAVRRESPDWIVTNRAKLYWTVWAVARAMGVRVALFRHLPDIRRWLTRCMLPRLVDRFFVVSEFARKHLVERGTPAGRVGVLYNPIDTHRLRGDPVKRGKTRLHLGIRPDDFVVGFAGRVEPQKGVRVLWAAVAPMMVDSERVRILCVGDGPDVARWRGEAARAGLHARCHFVSWTRCVGDFYPAMDVLVAPSVMPETFCRVIAEAQSCGLPVIGTRIGGIPEAFAPGTTGLLVEAGDCGALRLAIGRLISDRGLLRQFAVRGRRFAQDEFAARRIAELFVEALDGAGVGTGRRDSRRHRSNAADDLSGRTVRVVG
jgi:glycosyltransferase involved in cell wall biosynthesis